MNMSLPYARPKTRWVKFNGDTSIRERALLASESPGWNPKILDLSPYMKVIDYCFYPDSDEIHSFEVLLYKDSKHLRGLSNLMNVPRRVKAVYKKEVLLASSRSGEYWSIMEMWNKAEQAWDTYKKENRGK